MNKIFLFIALVIFGTIGLVFISNQNFSKPEPIDIKTDNTVEKENKDSTESAKKNGNQKMKQATIKTSKGDIVSSLYESEAPKTVENFVKKSQDGFYNNLTFHRVEDWVIQGGDPKGDGTGGGDIATELNDRPFVVGSLGVARGGDIKISNDSQFFITKKEASWLDKQYTNFGIVTKGMDVVNKMEIGDQILGITVD